MLALAAVLWLHQLHLRLQQQTESLQTLAGLVEQSSASQRILTDVVADKVTSERPSEFVARYDKAARARDEALKQVEIQKSINEALARRSRDLENHEVKLAAELTAANQEIEKLEKKVKDMPRLLDTISGLEESNQKQAQKLEAFDPWLSTEEGKRADAIQRELVRTRYSAYAGWGLCTLLGLGLVAGYLYLRPGTLEAGDAPPGPRPTSRTGPAIASSEARDHGQRPTGLETRGATVRPRVRQLLSHPHGVFFCLYLGLHGSLGPVARAAAARRHRHGR